MIYFIVNEKSKTGKGVSAWEQVEKKVSESGLPYEVYKTEYAGHAGKLAKMVSEKEDDDICLISVGGDGTMNEIINGITDFSRIRLGIIPNGSGNDFRRGLKLPADPLESWECIKMRIERGIEEYTEIDLGQVSWNGKEQKHLFGISSGVGLDAIVCKTVETSLLKKVLNKVHLGKLSYGIMTVKTLFSMETASAEVTYHTNDYERKVTHGKLIFAAAMNLYAEGGGVPMAPKGNPFDGLLSVCVAHDIPKWRTFCCFPLLLAAKHEKLHGFDVINSQKVCIRFEKPMVLHADGEYMDDVNEVVFESLAKKIKILM